MAFWEAAAREWSAGSQLQQEVPERGPQSQLMKVGASSWMRVRVLPGQLLMKMKLQQVAREGGAVAREVARESGSCAFHARPSQSLSEAGRSRFKTDRQGQGRPGGSHGRSVRFAPRAGRAW